MFDSRIQKTNDHIPILDPVTTSNYSYNSYELPNYVTQTSQSLRNRPKNDQHVGGVQLKVKEMLHHVDHDDESGTSSPPLWKNNRPISPTHPLQNSSNYRLLSPNARALAIAKGRWELMEMVKSMPESCYELSLKDLVEKNSVLESDQEACLIDKDEEDHHSSTASPRQHVHVQQKAKNIQRQESSKNKNDSKKGKMIRSESFENRRLFLKMFFPISLESKKKQKNVQKTASTKVSPKPEDKSSKIGEKDWLKRRFYRSSESDSSRTGSSSSESTNRSGSSGSNESTRNINRKKTGFLTCCWSRSCFSTGKSAE